MGFDGGTLERIVNGLRALPDRLPDLARTLGEHSRALGFAGSALLLLLLVAIAYSLVGRHRMAVRVERGLHPLRQRISPRAAPWLAALAQILAAAFLPLSLWAIHALCADLLGTQDPLFLVFAPLLVAWTRFMIGVALLREVLLRPLLPVPREHGRYLYAVGRWILAFGVLTSALVDAAQVLGAPADVVAFARAIFELSLILLLAAYLARRRAVMALFPDLPNRFYRGFVAGLDRLYFLALGVTLTTALLAWAGYVRLAGFVWLRTWTLVALFLVAVFVHHALRVTLRLWILGEHAPRESAQSLFRSASRLLDYVSVIAVGLLALEISGARAPLARLLAAPITSVGTRALSVLTIVQGGLIVAAFIFAARLVRDYLEDRIYPALAIDEGVAHAIDTSIVYSLSTIGVLAALEAVGLGLGSITVFAGALGIGIGFGLQTLASNLASGLVLIFSRALRKGDWVKVGDTVGVIQEVGVRATRLRSEDAIEYLVPNSEFVAGTIVNWTHSSPYVRVHVPVGVSYRSNPDEVREILARIASQTPHVEQAPRPEVRVTKFAESSIDFELLVWIHRKQVSEDEVTSALYFAIFRAFAEAGIEIPFPQRDLHIR
jgi:small-conductance mechanosensitive channel